jgi:hypothetical protein
MYSESGCLWQGRSNESVLWDDCFQGKSDGQQVDEGRRRCQVSHSLI